MPDEIKTLSSQLAQDPDSLVFLRLGELLRQKGQFDAAHRVALTGLERHPHLADAHDLYARILADKRDYERAFDEWDMTLRIAPNHIGALKGLAFLYFKVGRSEEHTSELQSLAYLVCRLLLEKKKKKSQRTLTHHTNATQSIGAGIM